MPRHRIVLLGILSLVVVYPIPDGPQEFADRADRYLKDKTDQGEFMGAVLVARDGKVLYEGGYGPANADWDVPNTPHTKFRLESITKQFTAAAILQLAERGKLKLDEPVSKFYPEAPTAWEKVTIHQLLAHTSGIPGNKSLADFPKGIAHPYTPRQLIATFRNKPLDFAPGVGWRYSNSGYDLLGYVIERVSGQNYADYVGRNIFEPLGMLDSGFDFNPAIVKRRAAGYTTQGKALRNARYVDMTLSYSAGGLYSTVEDMLKWDQGLYTEKILARNSIRSMLTPNKNGYGYGWFIEQEGGRTKVYHEGGDFGFAAFIARYPESKTFVIVLSNLEIAPVRKIAGDLATMSFGQATP